MLVQRLWRVCLAAALLPAGLMVGPSSSRGADLSQYLCSDFCAVLVFHPQRIGHSTLGEAVKSGLPPAVVNADPITAIVAAAKATKDPPKDIDLDKVGEVLKGKPIHRVMVIFDSTFNPKTREPNGAFIVQFDADIDTEAALSALFVGSEPAETNGVKYRRAKPTKPDDTPGGALFVDNRTLIAGEESTVKKMLAGGQGERPLLNQLKRASFNHDVIVEFYPEPMWAGLAKASGKTPEDIFASIPSKEQQAVVRDLKSASLVLDFSGDTLLHAEATTGKPETAAQMSTMCQGLLATAKTQIPALAKNPPPFVPPLFVPMISKLGLEAVNGATIKADGQLLTIDVTTPASLAESLKSLAQMFGGMLGTAK